MQEEYQPLKRFVDMQTVAEIWGVDYETIRRKVASNELSHMRIGAAIRIPVESVKKFEQEHLCLGKEVKKESTASLESGTNVIPMVTGPIGISPGRDALRLKRQIRQIKDKRKEP